MNQNVKITKTDALSFMLFITPIVIAGMGITPLLFGNLAFKRNFGREVILTGNNSEFFFLMAAGLFPILLFFYIRRLNLIKTIVNNGGIIDGKVIERQFIKDRGYIVYEYKLQKIKYKTINRIMKSPLTQKLSVGDKITICYDKKNPKRAFIKELYCRD